MLAHIGDLAEQHSFGHTERLQGTCVPFRALAMARARKYSIIEPQKCILETEFRALYEHEQPKASQ